MSWWRPKRRHPSLEAGIGAREGRGDESGWGRRVQVISTLLVAVVAAFAIGAKVDGFFDHGDGKARLEVAEVGVRNGRAEFNPVGSTELDQVAATEPRIEATVRNRGNETAWIEEARITVLDSVHLSTCVTQGGGGPEVPRSHPYEVDVPDFPVLDHRVIKRDLHVEVQPGHGARPVLALHNNWVENPSLYALRLEFVTGPGDHRLDVGRFVVGVPDPPDRGGQVLPESDEVLQSEAAQPGDVRTSSCFRHNLEGMRRLISQPGARSGYVAALNHVEPASAWHSFASHRPPKAEVALLFESFDGEAGIYAVEVAERTGEKAFETTVRERAGTWLLRLAREDLEEGFAVGAAENAKRALSLESSSVARHLLWQSEAAERAEN